MARISFQFQSKTISQPNSVNIFIPDKAVQKGNVENFPVVYLLHGKNDNQDTWLLESDTLHYANRYGFVLIMPYAANSFYTNMYYGDNYWDFIAKELPEAVYNSFKITKSKEKTFVCGYSMGGYGALKLGLSYPERYEAVATLSGSLRSIEETKVKIQNEARQDLLFAFGSCDEKVKCESDIYYLTEKLLDDGRKPPKIFIYCGTNDSLYNANCKFRDFAIKNELDVSFRDDEGSHNFYYWNKELKTFFETINNSQ